MDKKKLSQQKKKNPRTPCTVWLPDELHRRAKINAIRANETLDDWNRKAIELFNK